MTLHNEWMAGLLGQQRYTTSEWYFRTITNNNLCTGALEKRRYIYSDWIIGVLSQ